MKNVKCSKCGEEYNGELEKCPECGSKKRTNLFKFFIKMCLLLVLIFIFTSLSATSLGSSIINNKYGPDALAEIFFALILVVIILMSGNSYVFTGKKEPFLKSLGIGLPIIVITLMSFIISVLSIDGPIKIGNLSNLILFCLAIGTVEEFLFRGWLLNEFLERFSKTRRQAITSIVLSGIIFGLVHITNLVSTTNTFYTIIQIIQATSIGILFGAIYYRTKNIWACITLHAAYDFSIMLSEVNSIKDCVANYSSAPSILIYELFATLVIVLIYILATTILLSKSKMNKLVDEKEKLTAEDKKIEKKNNLLVYYCIIILEVVLISLQFVNIKGIDTGNICYKYNEIELDNYETHYINNKEFKLENGNASLKLYYDNKNNSLYLRNDAINYGIYFENELNNIMNYEVLDNENNYLIIIAYSNLVDTTEIEYIKVEKANINNSVESLNNIKYGINIYTLPLANNLGYLTRNNGKYKYPLIVSQYNENFIIDELNNLFYLKESK